MRITDLEVDRFGVWENLQLENLSSELTVFYGPNEAGKTTLMQFVRSVLYGFTPERRLKYLQAFITGKVGGSVHVADNHERLAISRYGTPGDELGTCTLTDRSGARLNYNRLADLLGGVDETTFINVFACGLREIQELGTLSDTEAATLLYDLTLGADRVSLSAAVRDVDAERNRLLGGDIRHSSIPQLLAERDRLREEIDDLHELTPRYVELCNRRTQLDREIEQHSGTAHIDREIRYVELAKAVADIWHARAELDRQLAEYGANDASAADLLVVLDGMDAKLKERKRRRRILRNKRRKLRVEAKAIPVNDPLCQQAAKLDALGEQQPWMTSLAGQIKKLEDEVAELELAAEAHQAVIYTPLKPSSPAVKSNQPSASARPTGSTGPLPQLSDRAVTELRNTTKLLAETGKRYRSLKGDLGLSGEHGTVETRIRAVLGDRAEHGLHKAVEDSGEHVSLLRRRIQLEEKLEQMVRREKELTALSSELFERQQLPTWQIVTLGGFFIFGAAMVLLYMAGWLLPESLTGRMGWPLALVGLASTAFASVGKLALEQSAASELEQCRRQLDALEDQLTHGREERAAIDESLPEGGGPLAVRLRDAEKNLTELEALLPLQSQREAAAHLSRDYSERRKQSKADWISARKRWRSALLAAGWPAGVKPRQFHAYRVGLQKTREAVQQLKLKRDELATRQRDYRSVADRIFQLASETGFTATGADALAKLKELQTTLIEHQQRRERRAGLRRQSLDLRRRQLRYERGITALTKKRSHLLLESGFSSEDDARKRALRHAEAQTLQRQRQSLAQQIALMLGMQATEETIGKYLDGRNLDETHKQLVNSLTSLRLSLQTKLEQRAELAQQIRALADDRRPAEKRLELASVERRIEQQVERWRALAITASLLGDVQASYERNRQPIALREATEHLSRMTSGKYTRVWTPLGEPELRVDEADGKSLSVEVLSAGTREQLFLGLRLALVKLYAERGVKLPIVFDDVLVNFDNQRAREAAVVLRDFARRGHQLLVFTCHEHIARIFKQLDVDVRELPINGRVSGLFDRPEPQPAEPPVPIVHAPKVAVPPAALAPAAPIEVRFQRIQYDPAPRRPRQKTGKVRIDHAERTVKLPPPKPARKPRKVTTRVERVNWDAEEFEGELRDQVGRRVAVSEPPGKPLDSPRLETDDETLEVDFSDAHGNGVA